jgi:polar amino acid transport system substrate-binding protein
MKIRSIAAVLASAALVAVMLDGCATASAPSAPKHTNSSSTATPASFNLLTPGQLLVAVSTEQPPFNQPSSAGKPEGFDIDLINSFAKANDLTVQYRILAPASGIQGVSTKEYDMDADGLGVTPERQQSLQFTKGIYWATTAFMTQKGSKVKTPADLSGLRVAVVTGSVQVGYLAEIPGAIAVSYPTTNAAVSALNSGTVDAFIVGEPSAPAYIAQFPKLKVAATQPVDHPTALAVQLGNKPLATAFNAHLQALVKNGTFLKLYKKYFGDMPSKKLTEIWKGLK